MEKAKVDNGTNGWVPKQKLCARIARSRGQRQDRKVLVYYDDGALNAQNRTMTS